MPGVTPPTPIAPRHPTLLRAHGDERIDDWYWLRNRDEPVVRAYLEAENAYTAAAMAYTVDTTGAERYELRVRDLAAGLDLPDVVPDVYYGLAWANDNRTIFYTRPDASMRPWQVWRHRLGAPVDDDVLAHQEDDDRFYA